MVTVANYYCIQRETRCLGDSFESVFSWVSSHLYKPIRFVKIKNVVTRTSSFCCNRPTYSLKENVKVSLVLKAAINTLS